MSDQLVMVTRSGNATPDFIMLSGLGGEAEVRTLVVTPPRPHSLYYIQSGGEGGTLYLVREHYFSATTFL